MCPSAEGMAAAFGSFSKSFGKPAIVTALWSSCDMYSGCLQPAIVPHTSNAIASLFFQRFMRGPHPSLTPVPAISYLPAPRHAWPDQNWFPMSRPGET